MTTADVSASAVDFAIVAALKVEREAVVRRLEDVRCIQSGEEPLAFYVGRLTVPDDPRPYSVVVVQLIDMGISEAGIATTRTIQRWRPEAVLMVGIAGGIEGKADLGDVVVAQFAYYYEPAKLLDDRVESRAREFECDRLLYARAQQFESTNWRTVIGVTRPDGSESHGLPSVHFGPIACGEKVIAGAGPLAALRSECPKMLAVAMEGAGVARAAASDASRPRYLEIRGISDLAVSAKNDDWHVYAANAAAAFTVEYIRSRPIPPTSEVKVPTHTEVGARTLVVVAESLRSIPDGEVLAALPPDLRERANVLHLDFTDLVKEKVLVDPEEAARRVAGPEGQLLAALRRHDVGCLAFCGLAAIPPVVLAGHVVGDRQPVRLFDYQPEVQKWAWPGNAAPHPDLASVGIPARAVSFQGDAVVRVSISYPVLKSHTDAIGLNAPLEIDLSLSHPARSIVRSEEQTRAYGCVFRETLDRIRACMPRCRRVHLFYAGPMALAFHIGQQISENIHPPVVAWNFTREYSWGIDLSAAVCGKRCVVFAPSSGPRDLA